MGQLQTQIRNIKPDDNPFLAKIIRDTLTEFGANHPGTVYYDSSTDALYQLFQKSKAVYFVAEMNGLLVGGGGIFPSEGLPKNTCELVKMYLLPQARGLGIGKSLIDKCLAAAMEEGFKNIYLETMPELKQALLVYEKFGFQYLDKPLGNSGHFGCNLWMSKKLV